MKLPITIEYNSGDQDHPRGVDRGVQPRQRADPVA